MSSLHHVSNSTVLPQARSLHNKFSHLHIANSYPIFRKTIGLNTRKEIIIEGSNNIEGPWQEYNFVYKPVHVNNSLAFAGKKFSKFVLVNWLIEIKCFLLMLLAHVTISYTTLLYDSNLSIIRLLFRNILEHIIFKCHVFKCNSK